MRNRNQVEAVLNHTYSVVLRYQSDILTGSTATWHTLNPKWRFRVLPERLNEPESHDKIFSR